MQLLSATQLGLTPEEYEEFAVAALVAGGFQLLWIKGPGAWELGITIRELDMGSSEKSILGQIYGTQQDGLAHLGVSAEQAGLLGFACIPGVVSESALTKGWQRVMGNRAGLRFANSLVNA